MKPRMKSNTSSAVVIGVDIGKDIFHLVGFAADGKTAFRRRIRRLGLKDAFEKLSPCIVAMEACLSAHFVSRTHVRWGTSHGLSRRSTSSPLSKGRRTTTTMPRQLPKQRYGQTYGSSRRRARIADLVVAQGDGRVVMLGSAAAYNRFDDGVGRGDSVGHRDSYG